MPGAYNSRDLPTGQFSGQERTHAVVGQRPTLPREADPRQMERKGEPVLGSGAGTLGQSGVLRGESVTSSTLTDQPLNPALTPSTTGLGRSAGSPAPSERSTVADRIPASGGAPGPESSKAAGVVTNNPTVPITADDKGKNPDSK